MILPEDGCVAKLARIDAGATPRLPYRIDGGRWSITVDRCSPAWLLRAAPRTGVSALPKATRAAHTADGIVAWLTPDAWLMIGDPDAGHDADCAIDVSARYLSLKVERDPVGFGTEFTGLDSGAITLGRSLPARVAGLPVILIPCVDSLLILTERGRERYWIEWLRRITQAV
jgi:hypothetical protein